MTAPQSQTRPPSAAVGIGPVVATLCGSTRFRTEFGQIDRTLTLAGVIVLGPGVFGHAEGSEPQTITGQVKRDLDQLHRAKIAMADIVVVLMPNGYIGESTRAEIEYAVELGRTVFYLDFSGVEMWRAQDRTSLAAALAAEADRPGRHIGVVAGELLVWEGARP
jgi:hypothetical protein